MEGHQHGCPTETRQTIQETVTPHQGFQAGISLALLMAVALLVFKSIWLAGGRTAETHHSDGPIRDGGSKGLVAPENPSTSQPSAPPAELQQLTVEAAEITQWMTVTAYCPCTQCCGPDARGITRSGRRVSANGGRFVAAPPAVPFGTMLIVPGYAGGEAVPVLDRGKAIKAGKLDVFFPSHQAALNWGVRRLAVRVLASPAQDQVAVNR